MSAGAGAGIAATFNTPLGGVLFALEILLPEVFKSHLSSGRRSDRGCDDDRTNSDRPGSGVCGSGRPVPMVATFNLQEAIAFVLLGLLCGVAAWAFIRLLVFMEDGFPKLSGNEYVQNIIGMAIDRPDDGGAHPRLRSFLHRRRRLFSHSGDPRPQDDGGGTSCAAIRAEADCHDRQPRLRRVGRDLLAIALPWRHSGRRLCGRDQFNSASFRTDAILGRHHRNGGHRRRRYGRRHDGHRHGLRNDPRLRDHCSGDRRGSVGCRRAGARSSTRRSTLSSCAIAGTAFRRSDISIFIWSGRPRTSWSAASSSPGPAQR